MQKSTIAHLVDPEIMRLILRPSRNSEARLAACGKSGKGLGNIRRHLMNNSFSIIFTIVVVAFCKQTNSSKEKLYLSIFPKVHCISH